MPRHSLCRVFLLGGIALSLLGVIEPAAAQRYEQLHQFAAPLADPYDKLVQGADGNFYGTTNAGGTSNNGTIFKITPAGVMTVIHSFGGQPLDGAEPYAGLIDGGDGFFYGTTFYGGTGNCGTVFKTDPAGKVTLMYSIPCNPKGFPNGGLLKGRDGYFYGTTEYGGANDTGSIFRMDSQGNATTLHSFDILTEGALPFGELIQAADGAFYGTTAIGGTANVGTVFKMDASGAVTTLHSFLGTGSGGLNGASPASLEGATPYSPLVQTSDGAFYGTTFAGGVDGNGTVFKVDKDALGNPQLTVLHPFTGQTTGDGSGPTAGLIIGTDGNFYGTTHNGGTNDNGTVFRMDRNGVVTVLHSFAGKPGDGSKPFGGITQGSDGNFYGVTRFGGTADLGTVYKMTPAGVVTILQSLKGNGQKPYGGLVQARDGGLYGTTNLGGGFNLGTVFKLSPSGTVTTVHSFAGAPSDGKGPIARLVQAADGLLYGTTNLGGANDLGTVFKMDSAGATTLLHSFAGQTADGSNPYAPLTQGKDGNFYGTTLTGGANDSGTLFKMTPTGSFSLLHSLATADGITPYAGLTEGSDGNFYGTASLGGLSNRGTIFKLSPAGAFSVLHLLLGGPAEGSKPYASLVPDGNGNFYGNTYFGGDSAGSYGTIFRVTPGGDLTTVHSFTGKPVGGSAPQAPMIRARDGNFYGTTTAGGTDGHGTVFKMDANGSVTVLHSFAGKPSDGDSPVDGLLEASDGNLYGTTEFGGPVNGGTIFRIVIALKPDAFSLIERDNVRLGSFISSEVVVLSGFAGQLDLSVSGAGSSQYRINGGSWTNAPGKVAAGDKLEVRHISASSENTATLTTLTVGTYSTGFKSVTTTLDRVPDAFDFGTVSGVDGGVKVASAPIVLTGYDLASIVAGPGAEYSIDGGSFTAASGSIRAGQKLAMRQTTNANHLGYTKNYLRVGGVTGYFTTRTK